MTLYIPKNNHIISQDQREIVSQRYKTVTRAVNSAIWNSDSDTSHSFYVGSYGRGTAIDTSDIDILVEVPQSFYVPYSYSSYNPQSRLLQVVRNAIKSYYSRSDVRGDGQVVVIDFYDGTKFEILPAIPQTTFSGDLIYKYPDSHMGGRWMSTNPKAEQDAMDKKNKASNGLLFDTCKHMRYIRDNYYSSKHLSGIVIDSFVFQAMGYWHWLSDSEVSSSKQGDYETVLLRYFNEQSINGLFPFRLTAPGSGDQVKISDSLECLGKVIKKIAE